MLKPSTCRAVTGQCSSRGTAASEDLIEAPPLTWHSPEGQGLRRFRLQHRDPPHTAASIEAKIVHR